jgi:hypothetical protein
MGYGVCTRTQGHYTAQMASDHHRTGTIGYSVIVHLLSDILVDESHLHDRENEMSDHPSELDTLKQEIERLNFEKQYLERRVVSLTLRHRMLLIASIAEFFMMVLLMYLFYSRCS